MLPSDRGTFWRVKEQCDFLETPHSAGCLRDATYTLAPSTVPAASEPVETKTRKSQAQARPSAHARTP